MQVKQVHSVDGPLQEAIHSLLPQLSLDPPLPTKVELEALVQSESTCLFVALANEPESAILGMVALVSYRIPSGHLSRIEDLVVDDGARGQGIGTALMEAAIRHARSLGSKAVDLTSNPDRRAANRLYQLRGFSRGRTNVYRLWLKPGASSGRNDR
ncbi:MAG: GNAT family N-acetyltransferase [Anaerolineales bacterium]